jgi:hypothetical protein
VFWAVVAWVAVIGANVWLFSSFLNEETKNNLTDTLYLIGVLAFFIVLPAILILFHLDKRKDKKFKKTLDVIEIYKNIEKENKGALRSLLLIAVVEKSLILCSCILLTSVTIIIFESLNLSQFAWWSFVIALFVYGFCSEHLMNYINKKNDLVSSKNQFLAYFTENIAKPFIKDKYGFDLIANSEKPHDFDKMLKKVGIYVRYTTNEGFLIIECHGCSGGFENVDIMYSIRSDEKIMYFLKMEWKNGRNSSIKYGVLSVSNNKVHFDKSKDLSFGLMNPQVQLFKLCSKYLDKL